MLRFANIFCFWATILIMFSCGRVKPQKPSNTADVDSTAMSLLEFNRLCIEDEKHEIEAYIDSVKTDGHGEFIWTDDGYSFRVITNGDSNIKINNGSEISITYSLELLNGTICYQTSNDSRVKKIIVGKRVLGKGVDLAVTGKCLGDEIELILPYNLAFGVAGDRNCVPPRTPVLYRIKILSVK